MDGQSPKDKARALFRDHGGILRTAEALNLGIHPRTLYAMRDSGDLQRLSRGLYRLTQLPPLAHPDLVTVSLKIPQAVICLVSALAFHDLTTQVPHVIDIALCSNSSKPVLEYPPLRIFWFSSSSWNSGVETHDLDNYPVRIFSPAKSVADSFKYRKKLGLDIAMEALRLYRKHSDFEVDLLLEYAKVCRVETIIRPYLESLL